MKNVLFILPLSGCAQLPGAADSAILSYIVMTGAALLW
jgi:hypothetical protein